MTRKKGQKKELRNRAGAYKARDSENDMRSEKIRRENDKRMLVNHVRGRLGIQIPTRTRQRHEGVHGTVGIENGQNRDDD